MPKVFLSPAQHAKPCLVPGCDERKHNNMICDAMIPHLDASGIEWMRNDWAEERPAEIVKKSNAFGPDLHFTFHTNGGGGRRCTFYNSGSAKSIRFSQILAKHYGVVYPHLIKPSDNYPPNVCTETWTELVATTAPAVYAEQWFHDNEADCAWGHAHISETAKSHVTAICEYLGVAFVEGGKPELEERLEAVARVVAAEARGEPYEGQVAIAQCIYDRLNDPAQRFGKSLNAVLAQFAKPYQGDMSRLTCVQAARAVFEQGVKQFGQTCLWVLGRKAAQSTVDDRNAKYTYLGQIANQRFWGDAKPQPKPPEQDMPMIQYGTSGEAVKEAQERLQAKGCQLPGYGADGVFGAETRAAVRAFQRARGIQVDGIIGPITWGELLK